MLTGHTLEARGVSFCQPPSPGVLVRWDAALVTGIVRQPLVDLRRVAMQRVQLLLDDGPDVDGDVRTERIGVPKSIAHVRNHRVSGQMIGQRHNVRDSHHIGGILDQNARVAVIWMVIIRPRAQDQVGLELADDPNDLSSVRQCWLELAVVVVEHLILGQSEDARDCLRFGVAASGEFDAADLVMASVAVRQRYELDAVSLLTVESGDASGGFDWTDGSCQGALPSWSGIARVARSRPLWYHTRITRAVRSIRDRKPRSKHHARDPPVVIVVERCRPAGDDT